METITRENLAENLKLLRGYDFPADLKELHEFILESSQNGKNWNADKEADVKAVSDSYFRLLNTFLKSGEKEQQNDKVRPNSKDQPGDESGQDSGRKKSSHETAKGEAGRKIRKHHEPSTDQDAESLFTERIPDEIRFIRRFISLYGKKKTKDDLLRFINALHRSMLEKKIRKTSPYAKQVMFIQDKLVKTFNSMTKATIVPISEKLVEEFRELVKSEKVYPSMQLIKRYINLNGKFGVKDKAKQLMEAMTKAFEKGRVSKSDKYYRIFDQMHLNLTKYIKNKTQKILSIHETELSGLNGLLNGLDGLGSQENDEVRGLDGIVEVETASLPEVGVMSLSEAKAAQYATIGLTDSYKELIGDACKPTHLFAYGDGGSGKSSFLLKYAEFLNKLGFKVLYIAGEQFDTPTFTRLVNHLNIHGNKDFVIVKDLNVRNLSDYDFVALDSKDSLGIEVEDFRQLKKVYPNQSFLISSQGTKSGDFTGSGQWRNEVDTMIYCEAGIAKSDNEKNRWGGHGEMNIFQDYSNAT